MWPVWPERKQEGGDDITQENVMMNDVSPSGGLLHGWRLGNSQNRNVPPYHRTTVPPYHRTVPGFTCTHL